MKSLNIKYREHFSYLWTECYQCLLYKGPGQIIHIWSSYDKGTIHQVYRKNKLIKQQTYFSGKAGLFNDFELVVSSRFSAK